MTAATPCLTCGALVAVPMIVEHNEWHQRIAQVAIESTRKIDTLTEQLQHLIGDKDGR